MIFKFNKYWLSIVTVFCVLFGISGSAAAFSKLERNVNKLIYERKFDEAYALLNSKKYDHAIDLSTLKIFKLV